MTSERQVEILNTIALTLKDNHTFTKGIFEILIKLYYNDTINSDEYIITKRLLRINKPTCENEYVEFIDNVYWLDTKPNENDNWWQPMFKAPVTRKIRINFIKKLISNIK